MKILSELFDKKIRRNRIDAQMALVPLALLEALSGSPISGDWPGAAMRPVIGMYSNDTATCSKLADQAEAWLKNAALVRTDGFVALSLRVYREGVDLSAQQALGEVLETEKQPIFEATRLRIPDRRHQRHHPCAVPWRRDRPGMNRPRAKRMISTFAKKGIFDEPIR